MRTLVATAAAVATAVLAGADPKATSELGACGDGGTAADGSSEDGAPHEAGCVPPSGSSHRLLDVCTSGEPAQTEHPAPACGLVFVQAGTAEELPFAWRTAAERISSDELDDDASLRFGAPAQDADVGRGAAAARQVPLSASESAVDPSAVGASALVLLEEQSQTGAPLDALLTRYTRAHHLPQDARAAVSAALDDVVRCQGRLDWRLAALGVEATARHRLLASLVLGGGLRAARRALPSITAEEEAWLEGLALPLEADGMDRATRLECPGWAWPAVFRAFGDEGVEREMQALQRAAPLDLRVNTLKSDRTDALAALRAAGFDASPTPYSPVRVGQALLTGALTSPRPRPRPAAELAC